MKTPRKHWRASVKMQKRARELRREMTPAERKLWQRICDRQLDGAYFRKQHAVGEYIVDFLCAKSKLVLELDGDTHAEQVEYDAKRTQWLNEQKHYRVIRFTNHEIHHDMDGVLGKILEAPEEKPPP